jgi:hypothetical protein
LCEVNFLIPMEKKGKYTIKEFFDFKDLAEYFFRKKRNRRNSDFSLRIMHGINKISIIIFLIAIIILIIRNIF